MGLANVGGGLFDAMPAGEGTSQTAVNGRFSTWKRPSSTPGHARRRLTSNENSERNGSQFQLFGLALPTSPQRNCDTFRFSHCAIS
jgi:hypothetical protein